VALAIETGVPHTVWLDDPRAMFTAARIFEDRERDRKRRRAG
jgi:hypothetical protein